MAHNRKLVLSGVSLTQARLRGIKSIQAGTQARDELEQEMIESDYLDGAPFKWVGLIVRYGLKDDDEPEYARIDQKDGELPLAIEIDTHRLLDASSFDELVQIFREATLIALVHAGKKYGLRTDRLEALLTATTGA